VRFLKIKQSLFISEKMKLQKIETKIYEVRGQKIMLDFDLAALYETETKRLKESVKRNLDRFPPDFMLYLPKLSLKI